MTNLIFTFDQITNHIKNNYNDISISQAYSNKNIIEIICSDCKTLLKIKEENFNNNGHIEKYGNLSCFVLYANIVFYN